MANDSAPPTSNGVGYGQATNESHHGDHIYKERHMKIICIGAGASGLLLAYKLQRSFQNFELILYEKNEEIAGTWYENRYPGCACDIPAHTYTWSFEPKADWSAVYAGSDEILDYFVNFAKKYELYKYCKMQHLVSGARWNDSNGGWDIDITNLTTGTTFSDYCDIFVNASGLLNSWKWPSIPGLKDFKGVLLHTANYDRATDLKGKHVGLIGNGSSAIQVLPAIHPHVSKVTTFIRRPTWVSPTQGFEPHTFSPEEIASFIEKPETHLEYRKTLEERTIGIFPMFLTKSGVQAGVREVMTGQMKEKLQDSDLSAKLIPPFGVGCRRITPGVGYLETLGKDNVEVVHGEISRITEKGVVSATDEKEHILDVLICATGFDTSYRPRFPLIGARGKNLAEVWKDEAECYFGVAVPDFPNYFTIAGPNTPVGNGPVLIALEAQVDYILKFANRWQTENIHSFSPKQEAVDDFAAFKDEFMKDTVWVDECRSWYKNHTISGRVCLWPGSTPHFLEAIADPRYDEWNVKYSGNRYRWLGNGYSSTEADSTADWAYYIRDKDDGEFLSHGKKMRMLNKSGTINRPELGADKGQSPL